MSDIEAAASGTASTDAGAGGGAPQTDTLDALFSQDQLIAGGHDVSRLQAFARSNPQDADEIGDRLLQAGRFTEYHCAGQLRLDAVAALAAAFLLYAGGSAAAQEPPLPPRPPADVGALTDLPQQPAVCAGASDVTPERLTCLRRAEVAARREMEAALGRARAVLARSPGRRAELDRTQAAWAQYVVARCEAEAPSRYAGGHGHDAEAATELCRTVHARRRAVELNGLVAAGG